MVCLLSKSTVHENYSEAPPESDRLMLQDRISIQDVQPRETRRPRKIKLSFVKQSARFREAST